MDTGLAIKEQDITVSVVSDPAQIKAVLSNPAIMATIAEGGCIETPEPNASEIWLGIYQDNNLAGLYNFHRINSVTLAMHVQILPEYRAVAARQSLRPMWEWFMVNVEDGIQKIISTIPVIYPNVKSFALFGGMVQEGINRKSYRKNDELHDQTTLGITRSEIEVWLNE